MPLTVGGQSIPGWLTCLLWPLPSWLTSHRTLKKKSNNSKRLSPAPQLGPSSDTHTSYYSESVVRESYIGSPRAASIAASLTRNSLLDDPYWSEYPQPSSRALASFRNLWFKIHPHPHRGFPNHCWARRGVPHLWKSWGEQPDV